MVKELWSGWLAEYTSIDRSKRFLGVKFCYFVPIKSGEVLLTVQKTKFDAGEYKIQLCVTCEIKFLAEINTSMLCKTISFLNDDDAWLRHKLHLTRLIGHVKNIPTNFHLHLNPSFLRLGRPVGRICSSLGLSQYNKTSGPLYRPKIPKWIRIHAVINRYWNI